MGAAKSSAHLEELAKRMAPLENQAFHEFAGIFGPRFRAYFLRCGLSAPDAEDLAVSCVTDIALKVEKYMPMENGGFEAWVFTLVRHALIDWQHKHPTTELLTEDQTQPDRGKPNPNIMQAVEDAVAQLSDIDQAIVQFRDLGGDHAYAEIGKLVGMSPGAVRVRHHRALQRLESILAQDPRIKDLLRTKKFEHAVGL